MYFLARLTQKMRAHMGGLSDLYVFAWTQPRAKREKKGEKNKREKKDIIHLTDRHESVRLLGISTIYGGKKRKRKPDGRG